MADELRRQRALARERDVLRARVAELEAIMEAGRSDPPRPADTTQFESEGHLRALVQNMPIAYFSYDRDGVVLSWNRAAEAMYGYRSDEALGVPLRDLFGDTNSTPASENWLERVFAGEVIADVEWRDRDKSGQLGYRVGTALPLTKADGTVLRGVVLCVDITERRRAEAALREQKEFTDNAVNAQMDTFFVFDPATGRPLLWNRTFREVSGYTDEEIAAKKAPDEWYDPEDLARAVQAVSHTLTEGPARVEISLVTKSGRRVPTEYLTSIIRDEDGAPKYIISIGRDVTERKRAREERERLEEQLRQSQKMEAIGQLAGGVAHDFNNLLSVISGYAELLQDGIPDDSSLHREVGQIKSAAARAARLTEQLLAFSRKQVISPRALRLSDVVAQLETMLGRLIGENIELVVVAAPDLWPVKVDPGQMDQLLVNLATNARDAMPDGGTLTIETANVTVRDARHGAPPGVVPGEHVVLRVRDTGHGMDETTKARVFEPFFSTREVGAGTGLGLSTVYGIVQQSGGSIDVSSSPGGGATFAIYFPRAEEEAEPAPPPTARVSDGSETVLLVEDEAMVRELALTVLKRRGYAVLTADNGDVALAVARKHPGKIDLLLSDVVMPGMNGRELCQRLRQERPGLRALYMSGYSYDVVTRHGVLEEGTHFIQKPFTIQALAERIRDALESRR